MGRFGRVASVAIGVLCLLCLQAGPQSASAAVPSYGFYPSNDFDKAKGFVIALHGGGWTGGRPQAHAYKMLFGLDVPARSSGFVTANFAYSSGAVRATREIEAFYRDLKRYGKPICLMGNSAGGNLALMVAIRVGASCVIANGAPTDLIRWDLTRQVRDPSAIDRYLRVGFNKDLNLMKRWSPVRFMGRIDFPVLYSGCSTDRVVPAFFGDAFARLSPLVTRLKLTHKALGNRRFAHCRTTWKEIARYRVAVQGMLTGV